MFHHSGVFTYQPYFQDKQSPLRCFLLLESVVFVSPESEMKQQEKNVCMSRGATTANKREKKKTTDRKL